METKLRQVRENKGFSQEQMAEYLKISQPQYYRKERGSSKIHEHEWNIIANVLEVNQNELRDQNTVVTVNDNNKEHFFYTSQILCLSEQLISELKEHVSTLKEKIIFVEEQYKSRLKDKDNQILFLKQNNKKSS